MGRAILTSTLVVSLVSCSYRGEGVSRRSADVPRTAAAPQAGVTSAERRTTNSTLDTRDVLLPAVAAASTREEPIQVLLPRRALSERPRRWVQIEGVVRVGPLPVAGATVRIERFVGLRSGSLEVRSDTEGRFVVRPLLGGRYRISATSPGLEMRQAVGLFARAGDDIRVALELFPGEPYEFVVLVSTRPDPPVVGRQAAVTLFVLRRTEDALEPVSDGVVTVVSLSGWALEDLPKRVRTDREGRVVLKGARCESTSPGHVIIVQMDRESVSARLPVCTAPQTSTSLTTTTTTPGQDGDGGGRGTSTTTTVGGRLP